VNNEAIFVETPPEVDLCLEQFYYIAQYEHALRVIGVPIEEMVSLGRDLPLDDQKLVFIYSTGRAGSTLAGQIFAQLDGVANISEPDALTDLVAYRHFYPENKVELNDLANAVVRLMCQVKAPGGHVIKGRSFAIEIGDILYDLFPAAKIVFLYRDAKSYWLILKLGLTRRMQTAEHIRSRIRKMLEHVSNGQTLNCIRWTCKRPSGPPKHAADCLETSVFMLE